MHSCVGGRKGSSDSLRSVLPLSQRGADGPPSLEADFPGKARWRVGAIRWIGDPVAPLFDTPESARRENMEVMARLTDEEGDPFAHMARSRVNPLEVRQIITEPDRDRRLRVADGQRRSYHSHLPHPETTRNMRNNPLPILSIPKSNSRGIHIRMPVRSATEGKGPPRLGLRERRPLKSNPLIRPKFIILSCGAWRRRVVLASILFIALWMFSVGALRRDQLRSHSLRWVLPCAWRVRTKTSKPLSENFAPEPVAGHAG